MVVHVDTVKRFFDYPIERVDKMKRGLAPGRVPTNIEKVNMDKRDVTAALIPTPIEKVNMD